MTRTPDAADPSNRAARQLLAIVPARGGSRGVLGKNMRRIAGKPMLAYTLEAVQEAGVATRVLVSSEDEEILQWADLHGWQTIRRPLHLATAEATIAEVALDVTRELAWTGVVGIFQPTSPLRSAASIREAWEQFQAGDWTSLMSVCRDPHLSWLEPTDPADPPTPLFDERVNRQFGAHRVLRETGAIQFVDSDTLESAGSLVTDRHTLFLLPPNEALDIDTVDDLRQARRILEEATVVFRIRANSLVGTGHLHHCLQLAEELVEQRCTFLLVDCDTFVIDALERIGHRWRSEVDVFNDLKDIVSAGKRVVINDVLDTEVDTVLAERAAGFVVVNIEDLGPGARHADWVINALYPPAPWSSVEVATGPRYATLRSEFQGLPARDHREVADRVLLTFGGTDPARLSERLSTALVAADQDLDITVILGPGAPEMDLPSSCRVLRDVASMASEMRRADVVITSAGRTVYEVAAVGTPVVVVAQNAREASHAHLGSEVGVLFLGIGDLVDDATVVGTTQRLLTNSNLRRELGERLQHSIDLNGAARIADGVRALLLEQPT